MYICFAILANVQQVTSCLGLQTVSSSAIYVRLLFAVWWECNALCLQFKFSMCVCVCLNVNVYKNNARIGIG